MGADLVLALLLAAQLSRPTLGTLTFLPIFEAENPEVKHVAELKRLKLAGDQDLVVMLANPYEIENDPSSGEWLWPKGALIGVFVQDYSERKNITTLTLLSESFGSSVRLERTREDELLLSRTSFGTPTERIKLTFDVRKKRLVSKITYAPIRVGTAVEMDGAIYVIVEEPPAGARLLVFRSKADETGFETVSDQQAARIPALSQLLQDWIRGNDAPPERPSLTFGPDRQYQLAHVPIDPWTKQKAIVERTARKRRIIPFPQSTMADFVARRQDLPDVRTRGWRPNPEDLREEMGPFQLSGDKLWFGKTFYAGEGSSGVGGFGYFDGATGTYKIFSPPELSPWSVTALMVESDAVWLGLVHRGEYQSPSGGLLRWDRLTQRIQRYPLRSMVKAICRSPNALYVATRDDISLLRTGRKFWEHYIVDVTGNGGYRLVPAF